MTTRRQSLGRWGEQTAAAYLQERGYTVLERNVHTPHGELDLVAQKDDLLVFVEVKTRSSQSFANPEDSVTLRKQAHLLMAAEHYLDQHPECPDTWQFDVIAIIYCTVGKPEIEHFENVIS